MGKIKKLNYWNFSWKTLLFLTSTLALFLSSSAITHAADKYWVGDENNRCDTQAEYIWSNEYCWATTSGGSGGAGEPTSSDIAIFDASSFSDSYIDSSFTGSVSGIDITSDYSYTIEQETDVAVFSDDFSQDGGTFEGNTHTLDIDYNFTVSGGTFNAPGTLEIRGDFDTRGGTFNHDNNEVVFDGNISTNYYSTGTLSLNKVSVNKTFPTTNSINIQSGSPKAVGALTLTDGSLSNGTFYAESDVEIEDTFDGGGAELELSGTGTPDINIYAGTSTPKLVLNNSNVVVEPIDTGTVEFGQLLEIQAGTLNMTAGSYNWTYSYYPSVGEITISGGTFNGNGNDITCTDMNIDGGTFNAGSGELTISASGFDQSAGIFNGSSLSSMSVDSSLNANGGTFSAPTNNDINIRGNLNLTGISTFNVNNSKIIFDRNFNSTLSASGTINLYELELNKTEVAGNNSLTVNTGTWNVTRGLFLTDGVFNNGTIHAKASIEVGSDFNGGTGTISIDGTSTQNFIQDADSSNGDLPNIIIDKSSGTLTLGNATYSNFRIEGEDWTYSNGTVDATTHNTTVFFVGPVNLDGQNNPTMEFYNVEFPSGTTTLTGDLDVENDLTISGGTLDTNGYDIYVGGDWSFSSGTFTPNTDTVYLDGSSQSIYGSTTFYNLDKQTSSTDTLTFESGEVQTITNTTTLKGAASNILSLASDSPGTDWNFDPQGTRDFQYLTPSDSNNNNSQWIGTAGLNISDGGSNTQWNFTDNIYWVNDDLDKVYSNGNNWSNSSGGPGGAGIPTQYHILVYDGAGLNGDSPCNIDASITVAGLSITSGYTDTVDCEDNYSIEIDGPTTIAGGVLQGPTGGDITHQENLTISNGNYGSSTAEITINGDLVLNTGSLFNATSAQFVDINSTTDTALDFNAGTLNAPAHTLYLAGNWDQESGTTFSNNNGTIAFDGTHASRSIYADGSPEFNDITIDKQDTADRITLQTAIDIDGDLNINNGTLNASGETINLEEDWIMADSGASFTHGNGSVIMDGGDQEFQGSTTFYNLTKILSGSSYDLTFEAGETQTFTNNMTLRGNVSNRLNLLSSITGTQAMIDPQNVRNVKFLTVKDSYNINASDIETQDLFIRDNGNNDGWNFTEPIPEFEIYLIVLILIIGIHLSKKQFQK